jgi:hypothetical protein
MLRPALLEVKRERRLQGNEEVRGDSTMWRQPPPAVRRAQPGSVDHQTAPRTIANTGDDTQNALQRQGAKAGRLFLADICALRIASEDSAAPPQLD